MKDKDFREAAEKYATDIFKATQTTQTHWTDRIGAFIDGADHGYNEGYSEAKKEVREWIPVSERLPEDRFAAVLVFDANKPHYQQHVQQASWFQQTGTFKIEVTGRHTNCVTHWMPLPEPPKSLSSFTDHEG